METPTLINLSECENTIEKRKELRDDVFNGDIDFWKGSIQIRIYIEDNKLVIYQAGSVKSMNNEPFILSKYDQHTIGNQTMRAIGINRDNNTLVDKITKQLLIQGYEPR